MKLLKLSIVACLVFSFGLVAAYGAGYIGLLSAGYPRAIWPALGSYETVRGTALPLRPIKAAEKLTARGEDLFARSGSRALLVSRGQAPMLEKYGDGGSVGKRFNSYSLVKSLVGALVLKAVAEGHISSLEDPLGNYLQGFGTLALRERAVGSFLNMRSGLDFERNTSDKTHRVLNINPFGNLADLHRLGPQRIAARLRPMPDLADRFRYQNVNTAILGVLLAKVYQMPLHTLLSEKIWQPAGAADAYWLRHVASDEVSAYCCLFATARDWVHVGRFLMINGSSSTPFLPKDLWNAYFGTHLSEEALVKGAYGLHVRHNLLDRAGEDLQGRFTYMMGQGGQIVYMMPEKDLVVVRFGERHSLLHSTLYSAWSSLD